MINNYYGQKWNGSSALQLSVSNEEVIPSGKKYYNFEFVNDLDCTVKINNSTDVIFVRKNQGLALEVVYSFKIVESSIPFNWIGQEG